MRGRLPGRNTEYKRAMDLFSVHMKVHHPDRDQPEWQVSDDITDVVYDLETSFFS